ncbi:MAG: guanylate kinase [Anaerolineaceae bacterium]|jgi:guanylate kinase
MDYPDIAFDLYHPQPLLIVISGLSGAGKDTVLGVLKKSRKPLSFVVTATSRAPRNSETHGVDYFFYSREEFEEMIERGEFLEVSVVYQDYKGIPKEQVRQAFESGKDVVLRVDVQGAQKLRSLYPEAVLIFITPENSKEWYERLVNRHTETRESIQMRVEMARRELESLNIFDYVVVNRQNCLNEAVDTILNIIDAEHHKMKHKKISL